MISIDFFFDYLRYERNCSDKTFIAYKHDIAQFQHFVIQQTGECEVETLDAEIVREWVMSLMDKGYTSTSVNRKISALRSLFKYLLKKGVISFDPLRKVVGPKTKHALPVFLKEKEINELLDNNDCNFFADNFEGIRDRMIIEMFYMTGMRSAELRGLKNTDIDFSAKVLKVTGKRNKQRLIPFGEELECEMRKYMKAKEENVKKGGAGIFFIDEKGESLSAEKVYTIVKANLSKVVTLKKRSPHVLRHTFATTMLNHDATLSAVKELLGHSSIATTQIYTHTTFEELKKTYKHAHPRA